jgi:FkbM family methyltransferase
MIDGQQAWYKAEIPLKNQTIIDLGANRGVLSDFFWSIGQGSNHVISVEPLPQNYKAIQKKINKNKASQKWTLECCAVSDHSGEIEFIRSHTKKYGWNSVQASLVDHSITLETIKVPCKPLTEINAKANVIKMDIEGGEYAIIDKYIADMPSVHTWAVELHMLKDRPLEKVLSQFTEEGFSLIAAGRQANSNKWSSIPINENLQWDQIPATSQSPDGKIFKMLHIIAKR